jgi:hypothetical protein
MTDNIESPHGLSEPQTDLDFVQEMPEYQERYHDYMARMLRLVEEQNDE